MPLFLMRGEDDEEEEEEEDDDDDDERNGKSLLTFECSLDPDVDL